MNMNMADDDDDNDVIIYFKPSRQGGPLQSFNSRKVFYRKEKEH